MRKRSSNLSFVLILNNVTYFPFVSQQCQLTFVKEFPNFSKQIDNLIIKSLLLLLSPPPQKKRQHIKPKSKKLILTAEIIINYFSAS